ncbi:LacI family transcriptional regulator [Litorilinea aerophila]|nr:LacI family transcriptional regulator [Litorilinea aerophila]
MKDVARAAGVSQTTVSFVVNQVADAGIPAETQERVWEAIRELGYRPNAIARGLRNRRTHTIGFISDEIATTPFAGQIIQGAQDTAWQFERLILLVNTGANKQMEQAAVEMMLERQVDGIIYATMYHRQVTPPEGLREVPAVLLDCYVADGSFPSVVPDEVNAGRVATEYLIARGHTRIAHISNVDPIPATHGRLEGYKSALADHGIPFDVSLVRAEVSDVPGGYRAGLALLQRSDRPTAIFCFNDRMAMGVYQAAAELGIAIPQELALVGFDNQEGIAARLRPPLTTLALPHYEMGQWAVNHLLALIEQPDTFANQPPIQHTITCPLIERASV